MGTLYDSYGNLVQGSGAKVGKLLIKNKKDIKKNKELVKELQITLKLINYEDGAWGTYKTKYYKKIKAEMNIRGLYDDTTLENMSLFIQSRGIENLHQPGVTGPYYTSLSIEEVLEYAKKEINKFGVSDCYYLTKKENDPLCGKLAKDNSFFKKTINIVERK